MIINPFIEQGIQQGLQKSIVKFLSSKFQQVPEDLQQKIFSLDDTQKLEMLFDASLEAESLDELAKNGFFGD